MNLTDLDDGWLDFEESLVLSEVFYSQSGRHDDQFHLLTFL